MKSWTTPTPEQVDAAIARLTTVEIYRYFFDRLENPNWVLPLKNKGYFSKPPPEQMNDDLGGLVFPPWPESEFLARVAGNCLNPDNILQVALQIPNTTNYRVNEDLIEIALKLPGSLAAVLSKKLLATLRDDRSISFLSVDRLGKLIVYLAVSNEVRLSLELLETVFRVKRKTTKYSDFEMRDAEAVLSRWDYGETILEVAQEVAKVDALATFKVFCGLLTNALIASSSDDLIGKKTDMSLIWRSGIDEDERDGAIRDTLISVVRDVALAIVNEGSCSVESVLDILRECGWDAHKRIALYVINTLTNVPTSIVSSALVSKDNFQNVALRNEYANLAKDRFGDLSADQQAQILLWIEEGPDVESFKRGRAGDATSEDEVKVYVEHWKMRRVAYIKEYISGAWLKRFNEFTNNHGAPAGYQSSRPEIWHGPTSPLEDDKLADMDFNSIIKFLSEWTPSNDPMTPSVDGLSRALERVVKNDAQKFLPRATELAHLNPSYLSSFLNGFSTAVDNVNPFPWQAVLDFCHEILQLSHRPENSQDEWSWMRKNIARLLSAGFNSSQPIPFKFDSLVWSILFPLTSDADPTPAHEQQFGGDNMEPHTLSINTTRGEAFNSLIKYAFWKKKGLAGDEDSESDFSLMPQVQEVLDRHLHEDPSLAIRSVYGYWFPWLKTLDSKWAVSVAPVIFGGGAQYNELNQAAWQTYINYIAPYDNVLAILRSDYQAAVDRLSTDIDEDQNKQHLGQHLVVFYARGKIAYDDSLIKDYFENASPSIRGQIMDFIGRSLHSEKNEMPAEFISKFQSLWELRLAVAKQSANKEQFKEEMAGFGWWFTSEYFDQKWALTQLRDALQISEKVDMPSDVVEKLTVFAHNEPLLVSECIHSIVKGDRNGWHTSDTREHIGEILKISIQSKNASARKLSREIINLFGSRGNMQFRDILNLDPEV